MRARATHQQHTHTPIILASGNALKFKQQDTNIFLSFTYLSCHLPIPPHTNTHRKKFNWNFCRRSKKQKNKIESTLSVNKQKHCELWFFVFRLCFSGSVSTIVSKSTYLRWEIKKCSIQKEQGIDILYPKQNCLHLYLCSFLCGSAQASRSDGDGTDRCQPTRIRPEIKKFLEPQEQYRNCVHRKYYTRIMYVFFLHIRVRTIRLNVEFTAQSNCTPTAVYSFPGKILGVEWMPRFHRTQYM